MITVRYWSNSNCSSVTSGICAPKKKNWTNKAITNAGETIDGQLVKNDWDCK